MNCDNINDNNNKILKKRNVNYETTKYIYSKCTNNNNSNHKLLTNRSVYMTKNGEHFYQNNLHSF